MGLFRHRFLKSRFFKRIVILMGMRSTLLEKKKRITAKSPRQFRIEMIQLRFFVRLGFAIHESSSERAPRLLSQGNLGGTLLESSILILNQIKFIWTCRRAIQEAHFFLFIIISMATGYTQLEFTNSGFTANHITIVNQLLDSQFYETLRERTLTQHY